MYVLVSAWWARDGQWSLVNFLYAVLLLTVPPFPAICKNRGHMPPCLMESAPWIRVQKFWPDRPSPHFKWLLATNHRSTQNASTIATMYIYYAIYSVNCKCQLYFLHCWSMNPTQTDPPELIDFVTRSTHGWTRPTSNSVLSVKSEWSFFIAPAFITVESTGYSKIISVTETSFESSVTTVYQLPV